MKTFIRSDPSVATGNSIVLSYESGCRHFVSCQPNNYSLAMSDIDPAMLSAAGHLLRADVWFSEPMLDGGNEELLRAARAQGVATSLDINWDPQWGSAEATTIARRKRSVRDILPWVDLVHGNVRELSEFADSQDLDATLRRITSWGAGAIVIHMGVQGAGYYCAGRLTVSPSVPVHQYKYDWQRGPVECLHDVDARPQRDSTGRPASPGQFDCRPVHRGAAWTDPRADLRASREKSRGLSQFSFHENGTVPVRNGEVILQSLLSEREAAYFSARHPASSAPMRRGETCAGSLPANDNYNYPFGR